MKDEIRSRANPRIKELLKLAKNVAPAKHFLVEGHKLIQEAFKANFKLESLWTDPSLGEPGAAALTDQLYRLVSPTKSGNPPLAVFAKKPFERCLHPEPALILYQVQDPGNAGAMIRAALAFGISQIVFVKPCVYPLHHTLIRSSAGTIFHGRILHVENLPDLSKHALVTADSNANTSVKDFVWPEPLALAMGNEGHGFSVDFADRAHSTVRIPHSEKVESLNVMGAMHIMLYDRSSKLGF